MTNIALAVLCKCEATFSKILWHRGRWKQQNPLRYQNSCSHATSAIRRKDKKGTGTAKSAKGRDAPIPPSIPFCIDSLAQHIDGSWEITNIYLSSLPSSFPPFFIREGEIVKWPSQSNRPPRIAVSKQLRIPSFWKESAGDFLNFPRSEEISAWKLLKWLLCLISIPISTSASPFLSPSLALFPLEWSFFPSIIFSFSARSETWGHRNFPCLTFICLELDRDKIPTGFHWFKGFFQSCSFPFSNRFFIKWKVRYAWPCLPIEIDSHRLNTTQNISEENDLRQASYIAVPIQPFTASTVIDTLWDLFMSALFERPPPPI